jgi:hypothetical protein
VTTANDGEVTDLYRAWRTPDAAATTSVHDPTQRAEGAPEPDRRDAAVVICVYTEDRWDRIVGAVTSVQKQDRPPVELLVVVDHNRRLFERIHRELPELWTVENTHPQGLAGARNTALDTVQSPLVAFLDDDAEAAPDWLARLVDALADPRVVAVGGHTAPVWTQGRPPWFPEEFNWVVGCSHRGMPTELEAVRNVTGGCSAMRADVVRAAGGYRTELGRRGSNFAGCEETELCIRMKRYNPDAVLLVDPHARIDHFLPEGRGRWAYFWRRCFAEGRSKALVSVMVGADQALSAERSYSSGVLPAGILAGLRRGMSGEWWGFARAAAIVAGFACACAGFASKRVALAVGRRPT